MNRPHFFALCFAVAVGGCTGIAHQADSPAVIVEPNEASRMELKSAASRALGVTDILLAPDALTSTSLLTIDRASARDAQGRPLNGRELGRPEQFTLVKSGQQCVLVHVGSGMRIPLDSVRCRATS